VFLWGFLANAGMERKDLIAKNAAIFGEQGEAIEKYASSNIKVLVIANPVGIAFTTRLCIFFSFSPFGYLVATILGR
jgi:malate/lactate dehydrogenase